MKRSIVAFIDVIGFKELIDSYFQGKSPNAWNHLETILNQAKKIALDKDNFPYSFNISTKFFSDCVCISIPIETKDSEEKFLLKFGLFIRTITLFQTMLFDGHYLQHNTNDLLLAKGGISIGGHEESEHLIFSEALVSSYKIEQTISQFPRIVIDEKLIKEVEEILSKASDKQFIKKLIEKHLVRDWEDTIFLNYMELFYLRIDSLFNSDEITAQFLVDEGWVNIESEELRKEFKKGFTKEHSIELITKSKKDRAERINAQINARLSCLTNIGDHNKWIKWKWLNEYSNWCYNKNDSKIIFSYFELGTFPPLS